MSPIPRLLVRSPTPAAGSAAPAPGSTTAKHSPLLLSLLATELGLSSADEIVDFELHVCDVQVCVHGRVHAVGQTHPAAWPTRRA